MSEKKTIVTYIPKLLSYLKQNKKDPNNQTIQQAIQKLIKHDLTPDNALSLIANYEQILELLENKLPDQAYSDLLLDSYQQLFSEQEQIISTLDKDERYSFVIVIPTADNPQQLNQCLHSIITLCQLYNYGGMADGLYKKITVVIAEDSKLNENRHKNRLLAINLTKQGLETFYFGLDEQIKQVNLLSDLQKEKLTGIFGSLDPDNFYHKGHALLRNIIYLYLKKHKENNSKKLIYFIDSDQEFKVRVPDHKGDRDIYLINYFYHLNKIFSEQAINIVTGKVVGDPPVSPAVMTGNFLADVLHFFNQMAKVKPDEPCTNHLRGEQKENGAFYHDMAALFGFDNNDQPYQYRCHLQGNHNNAQCFMNFSNKINGFFCGEHPTRYMYYSFENVMESIGSARTLYTGNYIMNFQGLSFFIPFAPLKLRMAGPTAGRIIKSNLQSKFVSANLPLLHKRTLKNSNQSEYRPGVDTENEITDLSNEFARQFYGDIMLFTIVELTNMGYAKLSRSEEIVETILNKTIEKMRQLYKNKQQEIIKKVEQLRDLITDKNYWWNQSSDYDLAKQNFIRFLRTMEYNFSKESKCYQFFQRESNYKDQLQSIKKAILGYTQDLNAWKEIIWDCSKFYID